MWLAILLACAAHGEPTPDPKAAPVAQEPEMTRFDLVQGKPVTLADPACTATLVSTSESVAKDASGRKVHRVSGVPRLESPAGADDVKFTLGAPFEWSGTRMVVREAAGWYELVVRPDGSAP